MITNFNLFENKEEIHKIGDIFRLRSGRQLYVVIRVYPEPGGGVLLLGRHGSYIFLETKETLTLKKMEIREAFNKYTDKFLEIYERLENKYQTHDINTIKIFNNIVKRWKHEVPEINIRLKAKKYNL